MARSLTYAGTLLAANVAGAACEMRRIERATQTNFQTGRREFASDAFEIGRTGWSG